MACEMHLMLLAG